MLNLISFFLSFFVFFLSLFSFGSDFHSPRTEALGGAGHAGPLLADAIYMNPSYISFIQTHALSVNYLFYQGNSLLNYYGNNLNVSVLDGSPDTLFQAGVGYTKRNDASFFHFTASKSLFHVFSVGLGTKAFFLNTNPSDGIFDGTFSTFFVIFPWLQTSLIIDNFLQSGASLNLYREVVFATKFNVDRILLIYVDPHWFPSVTSDIVSWGYEAGLEFPFFSDLFLRVGSFQNSTIPYQGQLGDGYSVGVGFLAPKVSIDYAHSRSTKPITAYAHHFGLTLYF